MGGAFETIYKFICFIFRSHYIRLFLHSILWHISRVPLWCWAMIVLVSIFVFFIQKLWLGKDSKQSRLWAYLTAYIVIVLSITVFCRERNSVMLYEFMPFWSYKKIVLERNLAIALENIDNILIFIPVGYLLQAVSVKKRIRTSICLGLLLSLIIETMQYFLKCGVLETDDILNNGLGTALGCVIYFLISGVRNRHKFKTGT